MVRRDSPAAGHSERARARTRVRTAIHEAVSTSSMAVDAARIALVAGGGGAQLLLQL